MTHVTCRLTAKNRNQLRYPTQYAWQSSMGYIYLVMSVRGGGGVGRRLVCRAGREEERGCRYDCTTTRPPRRRRRSSCRTGSLAGTCRRASGAAGPTWTRRARSTRWRRSCASGTPGTTASRDGASSTDSTTAPTCFATSSRRRRR